MTQITDTQPQWNVFIEALIALPEDSPEDPQVYFNLDTILLEGLEALKESMEATTPEAAQKPLEDFGIRYLHLGQS